MVAQVYAGSSIGYGVCRYQPFGLSRVCIDGVTHGVPRAVFRFLSHDTLGFGLTEPGRPGGLWWWGRL